MKLYNYDSITGEFTGESTALLDPLETQRAKEPRYLLPAHCTEKEPPAVRAKETPVWDGTQWKIVPDYRGQVGYNPTSGEAFTVLSLDDVFVSNPPPKLYSPNWNGSEWIETASAEDIQEIERGKALQTLEASDSGMARVVEDVITVLVVKGLVKESDFLQSVRDKLEERRALRERL